jgi:Family of unknown function (DUF6282)
MSELERPPSKAAWAAIRGAVDVHVHVGPDVIPRRLDDIDLAREFQRHGLDGFVIKSHYVPTAERADTVRRVVPDVSVAGAITLNHSVGGLNPAALEVSARLGARVVWMPTVDAANEWSGRSADSPAPAWGAFHERLMARPGYPPPISLLGEDGELVAPLVQCLEVVAAYDMVLATGHVGREEIFALVTRARAMGITAVLVTHAEFPSVDLSAEDQVALAGMGALIEHCYTTAFTGKTTWDKVFANLRATGPGAAVVSTDLGQAANPPVADGLADFADRLLEAGFSVDDVRTMAVVNPSRLLGVTASQPAASRIHGG